MTKTDLENWIPWKELEKAHTFYPEDVFGKALVAVYTLIQPRRLMDYYKMKILRRKKITEGALKRLMSTKKANDWNYVILWKSDDMPMEFIFNQFKTKDTYKRQILKIPDNLGKILRGYIRNG